MTAAGKCIAFFDFDGTLTTGDSLLPFLRFVAGRRGYYKGLIKSSLYLAGYTTGLIRNDIAKRALLRAVLSEIPYSTITERAKEFSDTVLPSMLREDGMKQLKWHQQQGHTCVLVSASLDVYLSHWCKQNSFDALLCTSLNQKYFSDNSDEITGENCFGAEKISRIESWKQNRSSETTYAYGDTRGDIPMLKYVDEGYLLSSGKFKRL